MTPNEAKELLGLTDNCTAHIKNVGNDCYRVNVIEKTRAKDSVVTRNTIVRSAYVQFRNGKYEDITISGK